MDAASETDPQLITGGYTIHIHVKEFNIFFLFGFPVFTDMMRF